MCDACQNEAKEAMLARELHEKYLNEYQKEDLMAKLREVLHEARHEMRQNFTRDPEAHDNPLEVEFSQSSWHYGFALGIIKGLEMIGTRDHKVGSSLHRLINAAKATVLAEENFSSDHFCEYCYRNFNQDDIRKFKINPSNLAVDYLDVLRDIQDEGGPNPKHVFIAVARKSNYEYETSCLEFTRGDYSTLSVDLVELRNRFNIDKSFNCFYICDTGNTLKLTDGYEHSKEISVREILKDFDEEFRAEQEKLETKEVPALFGLAALFAERGIGTA